MQSFVFVVLFICCFKSLDCVERNTENENSRLNYFDTDLLRYTTEGRKGNVMVSPASIKSCLSMILEGAVGVTAAEIRSALRLSPDKEEFREQLNNYLSFLRASTLQTRLENVNIVFVSNKLNISNDYAMMMRNIYYSEVLPIDFKDPVSATDIMNGWISRTTNGLIQSLIEPIHVSPTSDIFISNAMYFKSTWKYAFDPQQTHRDCFLTHGVCKTVAMMELHAELNYAFVDNLRSHAIDLPYDNGRYSMILLLPIEQNGVEGLLRDLPYMSLPQINKLLQPTEVDLSLPKFTVDYSEDMVEPLKNMRIKTLFTLSSNLSGIFEGDTATVNHLFHEVQMSVDESGTVVAAVTSAIIVPLIGDRVQVVVNKPFIFYIRDNVNGFILFEGKIDDPTGFEETTQKSSPINDMNTMIDSNIRFPK